MSGYCIKKGNDFDCDCRGGWQGKLCDEENPAVIDLCNPDPCDYGNCIDKGNDFDCGCFDGWQGILCDTPDTLVCSPTCVNGNSKDIGYGPECGCCDMWGGDARYIALCSPECENGSCKKEDGDYDSGVCDCWDGWTAEACNEEELYDNLCEDSFMCGNGDCIDLGGGDFECERFEGWTGE